MIHIFEFEIIHLSKVVKYILFVNMLSYLQKPIPVHSFILDIKYISFKCYYKYNFIL